ncbi:hypothetical protein M0812_28755 [Anaeramoeba flamelloides]|uniref:Uncharacterized protein n=1 Tax=Anaeramoeba flamelloides TaxID=1746091 RepID=A0AAV7YEG3_9EUKA|nr:hypothetical protein M0812_28755 [Anaeramoeba flamelloides]
MIDDTFYELFWSYGNFLYSTTPVTSTIRPNRKLKKYVQHLGLDYHKLSQDQRKKLGVVQQLFMQNRVFLHPLKSRKKPKSNLATSKDRTFKKKYYLGRVWSSVFMGTETKDPENDEKALKKSHLHRLQEIEVLENSRSQKTIGVLTFKIIQLLKKETYTGEELTRKTGFLKQRVSVVLKIYRLLKLIVKNPITGKYHLNHYQSEVLPDIKKYSSTILKSHQHKRLLLLKLFTLNQKFYELHQKHNERNTKMQNTREQIYQTVLRRIQSIKAFDRISEGKFHTNVHRQNGSGDQKKVFNSNNPDSQQKNGEILKQLSNISAILLQKQQYFDQKNERFLEQIKQLNSQRGHTFNDTHNMTKRKTNKKKPKISQSQPIRSNNNSYSWPLLNYNLGINENNNQGALSLQCHQPIQYKHEVNTLHNNTFIETNPKTNPTDIININTNKQKIAQGPSIKFVGNHNKSFQIAHQKNSSSELQGTDLFDATVSSPDFFDTNDFGKFELETLEIQNYNYDELHTTQTLFSNLFDDKHMETWYNSDLLINSNFDENIITRSYSSEF